MCKLKEFLKVALLVCPLFLPTSLHAQTLPVCAQTASDPDGDGFGWEFISTGFASGDFGSCLITGESEPQPVIINRETGGRVNLIRANWHLEKDISNRRIQCEPFEFDEASAVYVKDNAAYPDAGLWNRIDTIYQHDALSSQLPRMNTMYQLAVHRIPAGSSTDLSLSNPAWDEGFERVIPLWTINNGVYYGIAPLHSSPYVEIVNHGTGAANAVRVWGGNSSDPADSYQNCYAIDGTAFVPTGQPDSTGTALTPLDENVLVSMNFQGGEDLQSDLIDPGPVVNRETGVPVDFSNGIWNYNTQLAMKALRCHRSDWEWMEPLKYGFISLDDSIAGWTYVFHPYTGGDQVRVSYISHTNRARFWQTKSVALRNGQLGNWTENDANFTAWEQLADNIRIWDTDNALSFHQCQGNQVTRLFSGGNVATVGEPLRSIASPVEQETGNNNANNNNETDNGSSSNETDSGSSTNETDTDSSSNETGSGSASNETGSTTSVISGNETRPDQESSSGGGSFGTIFLLFLTVLKAGVWLRIKTLPISRNI